MVGVHKKHKPIKWVFWWMFSFYFFAYIYFIQLEIFLKCIFLTGCSWTSPWGGEFLTPQSLWYRMMRGMLVLFATTLVLHTSAAPVPVDLDAIRSVASQLEIGFIKFMQLRPADIALAILRVDKKVGYLPVAVPLYPRFYGWALLGDTVQYSKYGWLLWLSTFLRLRVGVELHSKLRL